MSAEERRKAWEAQRRGQKTADTYEGDDERSRAYRDQKAKEKAQALVEEVKNSSKWTEDEARERGLVDGPCGQWGDREFNIGIATIIPWTLNVAADLTDANGNFSWKPGHIKVKNQSPKYPVYFGLSGVLNYKLEPNEQVMIPLAIYYNVQGNNPPVRQPIRIKNWNSAGPIQGCP